MSELGDLYRDISDLYHEIFSEDDVLNANEANDYADEDDYRDED
jgi:hypothetical protein